MLSPAGVAMTVASSRRADCTLPPGASHCAWTFDTVSAAASGPDVAMSGDATTSTRSDTDAIGISMEMVTTLPGTIVTGRSIDSNPSSEALIR